MANLIKFALLLILGTTSSFAQTKTSAEAVAPRPVAAGCFEDVVCLIDEASAFIALEPNTETKDELLCEEAKARLSVGQLERAKNALTLIADTFSQSRCVQDVALSSAQLEDIDEALGLIESVQLDAVASAAVQRRFATIFFELGYADSARSLLSNTYPEDHAAVLFVEAARLARTGSHDLAQVEYDAAIAQMKNLLGESLYADKARAAATYHVLGLSEAISFAESLETHSDEAYVALIDELAKGGRYSEAASLIDELKVDFYRQMSIGVIASEQARSGSYVEAVVFALDLTASFANHSDRIYVLCEIARVLAATGQEAEAASVLADAVSLALNDASDNRSVDILKVGFALTENGQFEEAKALLLELKEVEYQDYLWSRIAIVNATRKNLNESSVAIEKIVSSAEKIKTMFQAAVALHKV